MKCPYKGLKCHTRKKECESVAYISCKKYKEYKSGKNNKVTSDDIIPEKKEYRK